MAETIALRVRFGVIASVQIVTEAKDRQHTSTEESASLEPFHKRRGLFAVDDVVAFDLPFGFLGSGRRAILGSRRAILGSRHENLHGLIVYSIGS